jgi:ABC-2 type transport system permease protein
MPGNRRGMLRRHAQSKLVGLLEHVLAILWAIAAVLALLGSSLWIGALLLTVPVLFYESAVRALSGRRPQTPVESSLAAP